MLLAELVPDFNAWDVTVLGTDINRQSLEKARRGIYTKWSFRGVPEALRDRYFEPEGGGAFAVRPKFKDRVSFAYLNLAWDPYPSLQNNTNAMDVIFCRNVMMYFVPQLVQNVIRRYCQCLVEGGWFVTAPSESSLLLASEFTSVPFDGATLYRKDSRKRAVPTVRTQVPPIAAKPAVETSAAGRPVPALKSAAPRDRAKSFAPPTMAPSAKRRPLPYEEALAAYRAGRYAEAAATLQSLLGADGCRGKGQAGDGNTFALMARICANQGLLDRAVEWSQKAIVADKVNPGFYYLLATILEEQYQVKDAVQALQRALYLDPDFILAQYALGNIALRENRRKEAQRHFRNAALLLSRIPKDDILPESEGVTAGRLLEIVETMTVKEVSAR
jgi:chemotaxis protein methyltransferase CheR